MRRIILLISAFSLSAFSFCFAQTEAVRKGSATDRLTEALKVPSGIALTVESGGTISASSGGEITLASGSTFTWTSGATFGGSPSAFLAAVGAFGGSTGSVDNAMLAADGAGGATLQARSITVPDAVTATQNAVGLVNAHAGQTNSSFFIAPKGDGAFYLGPVADGTTTGGNARGTYAVDLQRDRSSAGNVAAGVYSLVAGRNNQVGAGGTYSVALGHGSTVSVQMATALGTGHTINGAGHYGLAWGDTCSVSGTYAMAGGSHATATAYGERAYATYGLTVAGDSQESTYCIGAKTTDGTAGVELFCDGTLGTSDRMVLANDETWAFHALVVARRTDTDNTSACYIVQGCIDRNTGAASTALVGAVTTTTVAEDNVTYNATAVADTTNGSLKITVTGVAGHTVHWYGSVKVVKTKG